jgi:predicted transposase YbfD/YdcC
VQTWHLHPFDLEPLTADFPYARTLIVLRSQRTVKKSGNSTTESRYYLSSAPAQDYTPWQWLDLIRGHWGGVEVRNHWRRDALMGEDGSRSRHGRLLANVALIRNALLQVLSDALEKQSLPQLRERLHSHPGRCLALLADS